MTPINDILSAISSATEAYNRVPELEAEIRRLRDDLELARMEIEDKAKDIEVREAEIREQTVRINTLHAENRDLELKLNLATDTITSLRHEKTGLELDLAQSRIDNETKTITISALERDKASLEAAVHEERGLSASLRSTLDAIKSIIPAPEVAKSATFPSESVAAIDSGNSPSPVVDTPAPVVPAPVNPAEPMIDPAPKSWLRDYNAFNNFG